MRLIDADALIDAINQWMPEDPKELMESAIPPLENMAVSVLMTISEQPTIDAVPVIRCRDCKFLRFTGTMWKCQNRLVMMLCESNDYCSRAERKEE